MSRRILAVVAVLVLVAGCSGRSDRKASGPATGSTGPAATTDSTAPPVGGSTGAAVGGAAAGGSGGASAAPPTTVANVPLAPRSHLDPLPSVQVGGNVNEALCELSNSLVAKSGARWVRGFVNVPRNYLTFDTGGAAPGAGATGKVTGVLTANISQPPDSVSGDGDIIANDTITRLKQLKSISAAGRPVGVVLNLKLDFQYLNGGVPAPGSPEAGYWVSAIQQLLAQDELGAAIDVLVVGNEPMFETPREDAADFGTLLRTLVDAAAGWRGANAPKGWDYKIFVGALNKASSDTGNPIMAQVLDVARTDANVDGVDLHLHAESVAEAQADIDYVKGQGMDKALITTEFSLVSLWNAHAGDALGDWGTANGYPATMRLFEWLNTLMADAAAGRPIGTQKFMSYFSAQPWYPQGWFASFISMLSSEGVSVATYGLSSPVTDPNGGPSCAAQLAFQVVSSGGDGRAGNVPIGNGQSLSSELWVLDFLYNGALLGLASDYFAVPNPLVAGDFTNAVR